MKRLLILPLLLSACAAPSGTSSSSGNERDYMERKLISLRQTNAGYESGPDAALRAQAH